MSKLITKPTETSLKRILFIVNSDWFFMSHRLPIGIEALRKNFQVHIATSITDRQSILESYGFIVHSLHLKRGKSSLFSAITSFWQMLFILWRLKPDIVHLITIKPVLFGGIAARLLGIRNVVVSISGLGYVFTDRGFFASFRRWCIEFLYSQALCQNNLKIIFQNPSDMKTVKAFANISKGSSIMIRGSGVDLKDYSFVPEPQETPIVVMASRLLKDKGVYEFVDAARILKDRNIDVQFRLLGIPDPENPMSVLETEIAAWRKEDIVDCAGFCADISKAYSEANIVALPSYYGEGLPKTLIEASACGRAIITTDMPGCRDAIIPGVTGVLIPPRNALALADAVETMLNNHELRLKMGSAGRSFAEREFDINHVVTVHISIYENLLGV